MSWGEIFCFSQWLTQAAQANRSSLCRELCRLQTEERYCPKRSKPVPDTVKPVLLPEIVLVLLFTQQSKLTTPAALVSFEPSAHLPYFSMQADDTTGSSSLICEGHPSLVVYCGPLVAPLYIALLLSLWQSFFFFFFLISAFLSKP